MEYLKKDGTLTNKALECITELKNKKFRKLSDFYSCRSTKYPTVLNSDLFVISMNKNDIKEAGYATTTKSIIKINEKNDYAEKAIKELDRQEREEAEKRKDAEIKFKEMVANAIIFIKENERIVEVIKSKHGGSSKELQIVAWKLHNKALDKGLYITKTAMYHAL